MRATALSFFGDYRHFRRHIQILGKQSYFRVYFELYFFEVPLTPSILLCILLVASPCVALPMVPRGWINTFVAPG